MKGWGSRLRRNATAACEALLVVRVSDSDVGAVAVVVAAALSSALASSPHRGDWKLSCRKLFFSRKLAFPRGLLGSGVAQVGVELGEEVAERGRQAGVQLAV